MANPLPNFEFDPNSLVLKSEYMSKYASPYFERVGGVQAFIKKHKRPLVLSGAIHVQRGPGGTLINPPRFNQVSSDIIKGEARDYAMPFAEI